MLSGLISEKSKTIRQLRTSWLEAGERGRPVLFFCHGFPDDPAIWRHQLDAFAETFHVIAPFVRGCDMSEAANDLHRYGRDAVVMDHLEILDAVTNGNEPVICVGHDLGAVHAMTLARRLGERASGVIVINGMDLEMFARRLRDPAQVKRSWYMGLALMPVVPELIATFAPRTGSWLAQTLGHGEILPPDEAERFTKRALGPVNQYRAFARETIKRVADHPRIAAPLLAIWGKDDGVLLPPTQSEWNKVALDATVRIIPGGHWLHRDEAAVVTKFIGEFAVRQFKGSQVAGK